MAQRSVEEAVTHHSFRPFFVKGENDDDDDDE